MKNKRIDIKLRYSGPEVDDGTMSVEEFLEAVKGFSNIYTKISSIQGKVNHNIRINGIEKGSVDIMLLVRESLNAANNNAESIQNIANALTIASTSGGFVIGGIIYLVKLIKHIKKKPYTAKPLENGFVNITNSENVHLELPLSLYKIYVNNESSVKSDIFKMVKPLEDGRIQDVKLEAMVDGKVLETCNISIDEREYFDTQIESITKTDQVWVQGMFNSLTKTTSKGYFYLQGGERVPYEIVENFTKIKNFFFDDSPLEVYAVGHLDASLRIAKLDIHDIRSMQRNLFDKS